MRQPILDIRENHPSRRSCASATRDSHPIGSVRTHCQTGQIMLELTNNYDYHLATIAILADAEYGDGEIDPQWAGRWERIYRIAWATDSEYSDFWQERDEYVDAEQVNSY